ncbi:MAG: EFR1 family ferrodoxin [Candidatus Geothermincolia bacterium]
MARSLRLLILYYSGTGNTKFACDVAGIVMEGAGHEVTTTTYAKSKELELAGFDAYCFASPVYEWAPARNVEQFLGSMERLDGKCAFLLTTSAGAKGQATSLFAYMVGRKGLRILGDYNLTCPDSWGGTRRQSYKKDADTPTVSSVRELASFTERMLDSITRFIDGDIASTPGYTVRHTGLYWASRLSRLAPSARVKMGKKKVDVSSCTKCRVCEQNCPVSAITLCPYPEFNVKCIACWRCINTCPQDCITTLLDSGHHYRGIAAREDLLGRAGLK